MNFDLSFTGNIEQELRDFVGNYDSLVKELTEVSDEKFQRITDQINELIRKRTEISILKQRKLNELAAKKNEAQIKLTKIEIEKAQNAEQESLAELVKEIQDICKDFPAWHKARPYQIEGIVQIIQQYLSGKSGILNADEMSLGKTFMTLVATKIMFVMHQRKTGRKPRILWLTKKQLIQTGGTLQEFKFWYPEMKVFSLLGSEDAVAKDMAFEIADSGGITIICNYEAVRNTPRLKRIEWDFVIMDEVHKLKGGANPKPSQVWSEVKELKRGFVLMLTGTPMVNRLEEIWSYLHIFDPQVFDNSAKFARQFSAFKNMAGKLEFDSNAEKLLKDILKGRLIRRTAKEVGLQMPQEITREVILSHNPEQAKIYNQMRDNFYIWLESQDERYLTASSILAQLIRLRQINVLPVATFKERDPETGEVISEFKLDCRDSSKLDEAVEIIQQVGDQVIVGCTFKEPLEELAFRLQVEGLSSGIITSDHAKQMQNVVYDFQQKKIDALLINITMGEGMNLHKDSTKWPGGARAVIFLDKWYNNAKNDQFKARAIRPGNNEPVTVFNLTVDPSVDQWIQELCDLKDSQFSNFTEDSSLRPPEGWKKHLRKLLG